jgi:hypothetical protein
MLNAPRPAVPAQATPCAGASSTAVVARLPSTRPIITTNSGWRSMNSLVPSTGSTKKISEKSRKSANVSGALSSATIGTPGNSFSSRSQINAFARRSASVTGSDGPL